MHTAVECSTERLRSQQGRRLPQMSCCTSAQLSTLSTELATLPRGDVQLAQHACQVRPDDSHHHYNTTLSLDAVSTAWQPRHHWDSPGAQQHGCPTSKWTRRAAATSMQCMWHHTLIYACNRYTMHQHNAPVQSTAPLPPLCRLSPSLVTARHADAWVHAGWCKISCQSVVRGPHQSWAPQLIPWHDLQPWTPPTRHTTLCTYVHLCAATVRA